MSYKLLYSCVLCVCLLEHLLRLDIHVHMTYIHVHRTCVPGTRVPHDRVWYTGMYSTHRTFLLLLVFVLYPGTLLIHHKVIQHI
jgi:hypothetical protein